MHQTRLSVAVLLTAALALALLAVPASPAGAVVSGCTPTASGTGAAVPGAEIGEYPATPSGQSFAKLACTFTAGAVSAKFTMHDFENAFYHQGEARKVVTSAATPVGGSNVTLNAASGAALGGFVNHGIAGQGVPGRAFIKAVNTSTRVLTLNTPTVAAVAGDPTTGPIPVGATLSIDNGTSRSVADATIKNTTTVTSAKANFKPGTVAAGGDVGASIQATDIPENATITAVVSPTQITISAAGTGPATGDLNQVLTIGATTQTTSARTANDATYQAGNKVTSVAAAFKGDAQGDIGMPVTGPGIAAGAVITAIVGNQATLSAAVTVTSGAKTITVGGPSRTAPANGDSFQNWGAMLDLNPALVAGSNKCALNKPESFGIIGVWMNPGSFDPNTNIGPLQFGVQPAATAAVAQVLLKTAVVSFAGYVIQRPAGDATKAAPHYDITFPNVPTSLALCAASPAGVGVSIGTNATTSSQAAIPSGVGRPSTAQARGTKPLASGSAVTTATFKSDDPAKPFTAIGSCTVFATPTVDFHCGNG